MARGFDLVPYQHRAAVAPRPSLPARNAVAREILDLAGHHMLMPRLDGERPILGQTVAQMHAENGEDIVRRLTLTIGPAELLRILDFDNRRGFRHFSITAHASIPDPKVMPLLKKVRSAFGAAVRILEGKERELIAGAVDDLLDAGLSDAGFAARPDGPERPETPEIEDQRYRLTDDRGNQIIL